LFGFELKVVTCLEKSFEKVDGYIQNSLEKYGYKGAVFENLIMS